MRVPLVALSLLAACDRGDFDATLTLADGLSTVGWARWSTDEAGVSWVEHGPTRDLGARTVVSDEPTTEHEVLVGGLRASTSVWWRAYTQVGDEVLAGPLLQVETGAPPRDLPDMDADVATDDAAPGFTLFTSLGSDGVPSWIVVADAAGEPVWWHASDEEEVIAQARLGADGTSVLYNVAARDRSDDLGEIVRVRLDGEVVSRTTATLGHHDFVELPEGGFAYLAADIREDIVGNGTYDVVGDAIVEIAEGAESGVPVFSTWDSALPRMADPADDTGFYPQGLDWTHCNNVVHDAASDTWLLSTRNLDRLLKIDRATGTVSWTLGGDDGDFTLLEGRAFDGQHSPEWTDAGVLMFDNGGMEGETNAQAVEFAIDEDAGTYTEVWRYDGGGRHMTFLMGDADRLADGNTLVSWGNVGRITEVTPGGDVALQIDMGVGNPLGFSHHLDAFGGVP